MNELVNQEDGMRSKSRGRIRKAMARGMTLIEIMVVVAIIGMLMGTVGVYAFGRLKKARITDTKMVIKNVESALVHYQTENNDACPKSITDMVAQKILPKEPLDAWNQPLSFKCPGQHNTEGADIVSKGEDKNEGTADDIKSWEL